MRLALYQVVVLIGERIRCGALRGVERQQAVHSHDRRFDDALLRILEHLLQTAGRVLARDESHEALLRALRVLRILRRDSGGSAFCSSINHLAHRLCRRLAHDAL